MRFSCGCIISGDLDWDNLPENCPVVWDTLSGGYTKGVFQLEKSLGKRWCQKIKPQSIRDISDVISIIRPGCLETTFREDIESGKKYSIADTYVAIKDRMLEPEYIDSCLEPILKDTYSVPIYQEQLMKICENFAGFTLKEADDLRKAVGKKLPEKMAALKNKFIDGAVRNGKDKAIAEEVFSWIDKFSGYGFNLSHGISYAVNGYQTAFAKVHFPVQFFKAALTHSDSAINKLEEMKETVFEAKLFNIKVVQPSLNKMNADFAIFDDKTIGFGLGHIKGIGVSALKTLKGLSKIESEETLYKELFRGNITYKRDVVEALIKSGAIDYIDNRRHRLLARYRLLFDMTDRERNWLMDNGHLLANVQDWIELLTASNIPRPLDKRIAKLKDSVEELRKVLGGDTNKTRLGWEKFHLGMTISGSEVDIYSSSKSDTSCRDFLRVRNNSPVSIAAIIESMRMTKDKNGRNMCFLSISDNQYMLDSVVVFASVYEKVSRFIEVGNIVLVSGRKKDGSLLVNRIEVI